MSISINGLRRSKRIASQSSTPYTRYIYDGTNNSTNNSTNINDITPVNTENTYDIMPKITNSIYTTNLSGAVSIIKHYLNECDAAIGSEDKCAIANKLFEYLIANPNIYILHPRFRVTIKYKINELRNQLIAYQNEFDLDTEAKALIDTMTSINKKMHNSKYTHVMKDKMNDIKSLLYDYNHTIQNEPLMNTMNTLEEIMEKIKVHPNYVPSPIED